VTSTGNEHHLKQLGEAAEAGKQQLREELGEAAAG
jgi:hypothetical protein